MSKLLSFLSSHWNEVDINSTTPLTEPGQEDRRLILQNELLHYASSDPDNMVFASKENPNVYLVVSGFKTITDDLFEKHFRSAQSPDDHPKLTLSDITVDLDITATFVIKQPPPPPKPGVHVEIKLLPLINPNMMVQRIRFS